MSLPRLIALFFLIGICSCQRQSSQPTPIVLKDAPCDCPFISGQPTYTVNETPDSLTTYYLAVWKHKFMERNGLNESRFNTLIKYVSGALQPWREGVSFRVDFVYEQDWLRIRYSEQLRVNYDPETTKAYAVDVPRGVYLTESQILFRQPWDNVQPIQVGAKLAFSSCADACQALKTKTKYPVLKPGEVRFYTPTPLQTIPSNEPYLFSAGTIDSTANRCVFGRINLVTGEAQASEGPCWMY